MITQTTNLNLIPYGPPIVIHCDQYDEGTGRLIFNLYENDIAYTPTGTAVIQGTKPDNHGFNYNCTMVGNVVTADLTEQMTAVAGPVRCQIVVTESDGRTGSFAFILEVQMSALPDDTVLSDSDLQLVQQAIQDSAQAVIDSQESAEDAEAWAVGERNGVPVTSGDETYENNAKYWAGQSGSLGSLQDVSLSSVQDGQALVYDTNSSEWINADIVDADAVHWEDNSILGAKNLVKCNASTTTTNSVTFTVNDDGSVSLSGTATGGNAVISYNGEFTLPTDTPLTLSGGISNAIYIYMNGRKNGSYYKTYAEAKGSDVTFTIPSSDGIDSCYMSLRVNQDTNATGQTFYPMIRLASDTDNTYQPYAMTNKELTDIASKVGLIDVLTNADDLDNLTESGMYYATSSPANSPESVSYFALLSFYNTSSDAKQVIFKSGSSSGFVYIRSKGSGSWGSWFKFTGTVVS